MKLVKGLDWKELKSCALWGFMVLRLLKVIVVYKETKSEATVAFTVGLIYYTRGVTIHESKGVKSVQ